MSEAKRAWDLKRYHDRPKPESAESCCGFFFGTTGLAVHNARVHGRRASKACEFCGGAIQGSPSKVAMRRFCSLLCAGARRRSTPEMQESAKVRHREARQRYRDANRDRLKPVLAAQARDLRARKSSPEQRRRKADEMHRYYHDDTNGFRCRRLRRSRARYWGPELAPLAEAIYQLKKEATHRGA